MVHLPAGAVRVASSAVGGVARGVPLLPCKVGGTMRAAEEAWANQGGAASAVAAGGRQPRRWRHRMHLHSQPEISAAARQNAPLPLEPLQWQPEVRRSARRRASAGWRQQQGQIMHLKRCTQKSMKCIKSGSITQYHHLPICLGFYGATASPR